MLMYKSAPVLICCSKRGWKLVKLLPFICSSSIRTWCTSSYNKLFPFNNMLAIKSCLHHILFLSHFDGVVCRHISHYKQNVLLRNLLQVYINWCTGQTMFFKRRKQRKSNNVCMHRWPTNKLHLHPPLPESKNSGCPQSAYLFNTGAWKTRQTEHVKLKSAQGWKKEKRSTRRQTSSTGDEALPLCRKHHEVAHSVHSQHMHTRLTGTSGVPHASSHACPFRTHFLAAVFSFATVMQSTMLLQCPSLFTHAERENSATAAVTLYTTPCVLCLSGCVNETTRLVGQKNMSFTQEAIARVPWSSEEAALGARLRWKWSQSTVAVSQATKRWCMLALSAQCSGVC